MGANNVEPLLGNAEDIPLNDATIDVITSNGVLNLVPDKQVAFAELFRVMKPGGKLQISDIIIQRCEEDMVEAKTLGRMYCWRLIRGLLHAMAGRSRV